MLKPRRMATVESRVAATVNPSSWRGDKTSAQRGYGYRWQQARRDHLSANPLCTRCLTETPARYTPADTVDHIVPHRGDERLFWDRSNWQSLCASCHSSHKQREGAV
jgi:5-methylcytosine-specific restriction endonuclease McrA